jgi:hypothetical protein
MFTLIKSITRPQKNLKFESKELCEMRTYLWYMALAIPSSLRDLVILLSVNSLSPVSFIVPTDAR